MADLYVKHSPSDSSQNTHWREFIYLYMVSEVITQYYTIHNVHVYMVLESFSRKEIMKRHMMSHMKLLKDD